MVLDRLHLLERHFAEERRVDAGVMARLNEVLGALKGEGGGHAPGSRLCSER